jgi:hypothetical protein
MRCKHVSQNPLFSLIDFFFSPKNEFATMESHLKCETHILLIKMDQNFMGWELVSERERNGFSAS